MVLLRDKSLINLTISAAQNAQNLVVALYKNNPANEVFEQTGILDGQLIITDYIDHNEWGLALEHLFYVIYESEIDFPAEELKQLHELASKTNIDIPYLKNKAFQ